MKEEIKKVLLEEDVIKGIIERNKDKWFVEHIENHLKEEKIKGKVICKICGKDIDTIALEHIEEWAKYISKEMPNLLRKN